MRGAVVRARGFVIVFVAAAAPPSSGSRGGAGGRAATTRPSPGPTGRVETKKGPVSRDCEAASRRRLSSSRCCLTSSGPGLGPVTMAAWWYRASAMTGDPRGARRDRGGVAQSHPPRKPKRLGEAKVSEASHGMSHGTASENPRERSVADRKPCPSRARARGEGEASTMTSALAPAAPVPPAVARFPRREGRRRGTRAPGASSASARVETDADVIANHERILGIRDAPKDTVLMFSYGANINPYTLNRRGIGPTASAVARAPGRRLVFIHRGGYASLEVAVDDDATKNDAGLGERTRGALGTVHRISKTELAAVRRWEIGYEMREIDVVVADPRGTERRATRMGTGMRMGTARSTASEAAATTTRGRKSRGSPRMTWRRASDASARRCSSRRGPRG